MGNNLSRTYRQHPDTLVFVAGATYGIVLFLLLYGPKVLNVTYDAWLLTGSDLTQHYIGWLCYRNSPWHFPLGLMTGLIEPYTTSIIFTDSIPHFALLFKLFSPLLPETFQYFGIYGLLSFSLMGGFSTLLLQKNLNCLSLCTLLSTFFILSPYVMQRLFAQTALGGGQWITIASLYIWLYKPFAYKKYLQPLLWLVLAFVVSGVHMYLLPCLFAILGMWCLQNFLEKNIFIPIITFIFATITVFFNFWLYGAFYGNTSLESGGLGLYSANLNTLFDPQNTSSLLLTLPHGPGQYEGYGYLGLGILFLCAVSLLLIFCGPKKTSPFFTNQQKILLAILVFFFTVLALSPVIMLGDKVIFEIPLPKFIEKAWGIFRSSGRFIWPVCYIVIFLSVITVFHTFLAAKYRIHITAICLILLQLLDLSPLVLSVYRAEKYRTYISYEPALQQEAWVHLFATKSHIVYQPYSAFIYESGGYDLTYLALKNHVTTSNFYLARSDTNALKQFNDTIQSELDRGYIREDTIYIFAPDDANIAHYDLSLYQIDGMIVGISEEDSVLENTAGVQKYLPSPAT